jgi:hypothetical protein
MVTYRKLGLWPIRTNQFQGKGFIMLRRTALFRLLTLATMLVASHVVGWPSFEAYAQQPQQNSRIEPGSLSTYPAPGSPIMGGYSTTLSEVWGPPKMPPAPTDFGPHFDFPSGGYGSLNGPPLHDPYPN